MHSRENVTLLRQNYIIFSRDSVPFRRSGMFCSLSPFLFWYARVFDLLSLFILMDVIVFFSICVSLSLNCVFLGLVLFGNLLCNVLAFLRNLHQHFSVCEKENVSAFAYIHNLTT